MTKWLTAILMTWSASLAAAALLVIWHDIDHFYVNKTELAEPCVTGDWRYQAQTLWG